MALMVFIKKQFIDILEWTEAGDGTLAWRYPMAGNEIQHGPSLTVRESQVAVFVNEGRVADSALLNFSDAEQTYFDNVARVPVGSIVELHRGSPRILTKYYDPLALPKVRLSSAEDYIARAGELLDEGVRKSAASATRAAAHPPRPTLTTTSLARER